MLMRSFANKMQSVPSWRSLFRWNEITDWRRNHQRLTKGKQLRYLPFKEIAELVNLFTHLKLKKRNETSPYTARHRGCSQSMCCFFFSPARCVLKYTFFRVLAGVQSKKNKKKFILFFFIQFLYLLRHVKHFSLGCIFGCFGWECNFFGAK